MANKKPTTKKKSASKKSKKKITTVKNRKIIIPKKARKKITKKQLFMSIIVLFFLGILLIFSSYAWFSTSLNVRVKNFNMIVTRNSGLQISLDGVNFDSFVELTEENIITNLTKTYKNHINQWSSLGLTPVSTMGISNQNNPKYDIYASGGVRYKSKNKDNGFIKTTLIDEVKPTAYNYFIAFDLFFKNSTGSPVSDNLYLDEGTEVTMDSDSSEEMMGLVNSIRIGFLRIGSVSLDATPNEIQSVTCNNNCASTIYEPNSKNHTELSIERAKKYGINLQDGNEFPTYACIKAGGPIYVSDTVSGSANLDKNYFQLQNTMTDKDFNNPLFTIPNGITKVRVYVWIEGQDIDSLETDSEGADISISINLIKDTQGYDTFN